MGCYCQLGCCHCGPSMSKTVQVISVLDLAISIIYVTYETTNFGMLTGLIQPHRNCSTNCTILLRDYVPETMLKKFDFDTFTVMTMIVLIFVAFICEAFLYSKLKHGRRLRVHLFCKQWLEWRTVLLLITVLMSIGKVFRGFYSVYFDGIVDGVTKLYRLVTLWCVKCFMRELEETVGIVYVKPPKPRKRGSLSLK